MIRNSKPEDAQQIAPLIIQAMGDLAMKFTQSDNLDRAFSVFEFFVSQPQNQYSFENTLVYEENDEIIGSIIGYDGDKLDELRRPFLAYLKENYQFEIQPEDETEAGEIYLDTVSVNPNHQGKGIGKKLILALIEQSKQLGHQKVGLLVDIDNPSAKKLYENIGFQKAGIKTLMGGTYEHLVYLIS